MRDLTKQAAAPRVCLVLLPVLTSYLIVHTQGQSVDKGIYRVDFQNFMYRSPCLADDDLLIHTRDGSFREEHGDEKLFLKVWRVTYGDLTGDRRDEAAVLTICDTGGSGRFTRGFIYTMRKGRVAELTQVEGGDRAFYGIHDIHMERGLLVVERFAPVEEGVGACCPKYINTKRYRWNGRRLVQAGKTHRKDVRNQEAEEDKKR
jgi:hypothetical protein